MEKITAGEICVTIRERKHFFNRKRTVRQLAEKEFIRLGIGKKRDNTGILIFLILEDRQFYILAGSGINEKVPQSTWDNIKGEMQNMFVNGDFCKGILHGIEKIGEILALHFPAKPNDTNGFSDNVRIEV